MEFYDGRKYKIKYMGGYKEIPFCIAVCVIAAFFGGFYARWVFVPDDIGLHMEVAKYMFTDKLGETPEAVGAMAYPLYHICLNVLHAVLGVDFEAAAALLLPCCIVLAIYMYRRLILYIINSRKRVDLYFADIVSVCGVIFGVARCGWNAWRYYALQASPNPMHNPTIIFVRPIAIASFLMFCIFIEQYFQKKAFIKELLYFSICTALSAAGKPSYATVFLPAMGLVVLIKMLKNKDIKIGLISLAAVAPSIVLMIGQLIFIQRNSAVLHEIKVQFGSFSGFSVKEVVGVSLVAFPVVIILLNKEFFKTNITYQTALLALLVGWGQFFCLDDGIAGNFSWGYDLAVSFATIVSLAYSRMTPKGNLLVYKMKKWIAYAVFAYQVYTGLQYILIMYQNTGSFWF